MKLAAGWGAAGAAPVAVAWAAAGGVASGWLLQGLRLLQAIHAIRAIQPIRSIHSIQPTQDNRETAGAVGPDGVARGVALLAGSPRGGCYRGYGCYRRYR